MEAKAKVIGIKIAFSLLLSNNGYRSHHYNKMMEKYSDLKDEAALTKEMKKWSLKNLQAYGENVSN